MDFGIDFPVFLSMPVRNSHVCFFMYDALLGKYLKGEEGYEEQRRRRRRDRDVVLWRFFPFS